jgi:hypothetical protein
VRLAAVDRVRRALGPTVHRVDVRTSFMLDAIASHQQLEIGE